jgi:hypothetical protein
MLLYNAVTSWRSMPAQVIPQATRAIYKPPDATGMRKLRPVTLASMNVAAVYIPSGNTRLQYGVTHTAAQSEHDPWQYQQG